MRIRFHAAVALLALAASQAALADSPLQKSLRQSVRKPPSAAPSSEVVVVMRLDPAKGAKPAQTDAHVQEMVSFLGKQPGYVDGQFLRNINPSSSPRYLHVTRWKSFSDWERLFTDPAFTAEIDRESPFVSAVGSAFVQVR